MSSNNLDIFCSNLLDEEKLDEELVSDKVQLLANSIYREFEAIIELHGSGTVDALAPLIIAVLETMDKLYSNRDELVMKLDILKKDQAELFTQYEREKAQRKIADNKLCSLEDQYEGEKQELEMRLDQIESTNKMLEMKLRNSRELVSRVEEKENELRRELTGLQQRHADLLLSMKPSSVDTSNGEIKKSGQENDRHITLEDIKSSLETNNNGYAEGELKDVDDVSVQDTEFSNEQIKKSGKVNMRSLKQEIEDDDLIYSSDEKDVPIPSEFNVSNDKSEGIPDNYEDFDYDREVVDDTDEFEDDYGLNMEKEIKFLIKENQELTETKIALNIVKDDLITRLDELTGELYVTQEELKSCQSIKKEYKAQLSELEKRLHSLESEREATKEASNHELVECEVDVGGKSSITKITRSEISRILVERNKFKEELMELRDLIRYQSSANVTNQKPGGTNIYKLFSSVISTATDTLRFYSLNEPSSNQNQIQESEYPPMRMQTNNIPGSAQRISTNPLLAQFEQAHAQMNNFDLLPP